MNKAIDSSFSMTKATKNILDVYNTRVKLYELYGIEVCNILESILLIDDTKYQITYRVKNIDSLKAKIARKILEGKPYKRLEDIKDVLGIRVVFYTEMDRKKFITKLSRKLKNQVELRELHKVSGYRSTHAVITFGDERTTLPEYLIFKGLKCEVQLTLILNHAWAEIEHDVLYKDVASIHKLDKKEYTRLKNKMEKVMVQYIKNASRELESVVRKIKKIRSKRKDIDTATDSKKIRS